MTNDVPKYDYNTEAPVACSLMGKELFKRKELLRKDIFSKVKGIEEIDSGYIFSFQYDKTFLHRMTYYMITEIECCPFFTFETRLHSKEDALLKIMGSSRSAKEMIKEFLKEIDN